MGNLILFTFIGMAVMAALGVSLLMRAVRNYKERKKDVVDIVFGIICLGVAILGTGYGIYFVVVLKSLY